MGMQSQRKQNSIQWKRIRERILRRDGFICVYCHEQANTVDHVQPISKGGTDEPDNLVAACGKCNSKKSNKLPHLFFEPVSTTVSIRGLISPQNGSISHE